MAVFLWGGIVGAMQQDDQQGKEGGGAQEVLDVSLPERYDELLKASSAQKVIETEPSDKPSQRTIPCLFPRCSPDCCSKLAAISALLTLDKLIFLGFL